MNLRKDYRPTEYAFPTLESILAVERVIGNFVGPHIYVGGASVGFYVDDAGSEEMRPTDDVDVVVEVASEIARINLDESLRRGGLVNDINGPICRWILNGLKLDIMPSDSRILGFANRWYPAAIQTAISIQMGTLTIGIPNVAAFIATKIEAYADRGNKDFIGSSDFEDLVRIFDGCSFLCLEGQEASKDVLQFVTNTLRHWIGLRGFEDALAAHLLDDGSYRRRQIVMDRIQALINLTKDYEL